MANEIIESKLKDLPASPGVYLMKDKGGRVIYVGKALSLKNRVRSYFQKRANLDPKTHTMVEKVEDLDYLVTDSEVEALILESNLIKENQPRYNILLKDDKHYPYIKVTLQEPYPRIFLDRKIIKDGNRYFGPYTSSGAVRSTLDLLRKIFPLRSCKQELTPGRTKGRPCLNHQIGRCLAPCNGELDIEEYRKVVKEVILFLEGKQETLSKDFKKKMKKAATELRFEEAASWRDRHRDLEVIMERQKMVSEDLQDRDVLALVDSETYKETALVQVLFVRGGKLVGKEQFFLKNTGGRNPEEIMQSFVKQFYSRTSDIPREILLSKDVDEQVLIEDWLKTLRGSRVYIRSPRRGVKKGLVDMAEKNAKLYLKQREAFQSRSQSLALEGLEELALLLNLDLPPHRIEGYDISNLQGENQVASRVVFIAGEPCKDEYRRYKIRTVRGPDDYASMREVIGRRFKSYSKGEKEPPDLILIDGGKGQLSSAQKSLEELGLNLSVISLAKQEEIIFRGDGKDPLDLPATSPALRLLQQVRDEAHRFALSYHRTLRSKEFRKGSLDEVPGIGPTRKKALLKHFGSLDAIKKASLEDLLKVDGIDHATATKLKELS